MVRVSVGDLFQFASGKILRTFYFTEQKVYEQTIAGAVTSKPYCTKTQPNEIENGAVIGEAMCYFDAKKIP